MIIDLDAHQGNGHERDRDYINNNNNNKKVVIFDLYNGDTWPRDTIAQNSIDFDCPVKKYASDTEYLKKLKDNLPDAIAKTKPDFIIYNAGTDIIKGDKIGKLGVSPEGVIDRDAFVFKLAIENNIPILMLLSGGYTSKSGPAVGKSVKNLSDTVLKDMFYIKQ